MADPRAEWTIYEGEGGGPQVEVVRQFVVHQGDGKRMAKDEGTSTPPGSRGDPFKEAVAEVEAALTRAHLGELERLEARLTRQKDEEIARLKGTHDVQIEALRVQHDVNLATQSASIEHMIDARDEAHETFSQSNEALHEALEASLREEISRLGARVKALSVESEELRRRLT